MKPMLAGLVLLITAIPLLLFFLWGLSSSTQEDPREDYLLRFPKR